MDSSRVSCRKRSLKVISAGDIEESLRRHNSSVEKSSPYVKIFSRKLPLDNYAKVLIGEV